MIKKLFKLSLACLQIRKECGRICMSEAAKEIKTINVANATATFDISVFNDGAWQGCSFASMNGNRVWKKSHYFSRIKTYY